MITFLLILVESELRQLALVILLEFISVFNKENSAVDINSMLVSNLLENGSVGHLLVFRDEVHQTSFFGVQDLLFQSFEGVDKAVRKLT